MTLTDYSNCVKLNLQTFFIYFLFVAFASCQYHMARSIFFINIKWRESGWCSQTEALTSISPLSSPYPCLLLEVRRTRFCLLDGLMRQRRRSEVPGQRQDHGRVGILINPVHVNQFNTLNQGAVFTPGLFVVQILDGGVQTREIVDMRETERERNRQDSGSATAAQVQGYNYL